MQALWQKSKGKYSLKLFEGFNVTPFILKLKNIYNNFLIFFNKFFVYKLKRFKITTILLCLLILLLLGGGVYYLNKRTSFLNRINTYGSALLQKVNVSNKLKNIFFKSDNNWTKNPSLKELPINSVVKIVVKTGEDTEAVGSGLLFTDEGHILTNAHVVMSVIATPLDDIKICITEENVYEPKCIYDAKVIDADYELDIAVIKVDKKITEIKPYYLIVEEDYESKGKETLDVGSEITVVGYPGVGNSTVTVTKGIASGYNVKEIFYDDGSIQKIPAYVKTDTEINFGNSGGGAFDKQNRYIGIPRSMQKDEGGKISYIIFWNTISMYLNDLVYKGLLKMPDNQYVKRSIKKGEENLWEGIKAYKKEDYGIAKDKLKAYTDLYKQDERGWFYLCETYYENSEYEELKKCSEEMRALNGKGLALTWLNTSFYYSEKDKPENDKAIEAASKALDLEPDSMAALQTKTLQLISGKKIDEAEELNKKTIKLDEFDSSSWYLKSMIDFERNNFEESASSAEYSFWLSPDENNAYFLSSMYYPTQGEDWEDAGKSIFYGVASLVLGSKNPNNIKNINDLLVEYFIYATDEGASYNEVLEDIKGFLYDLNLKGDIIASTENISDENAKEYFLDEEKKDDISQTQIENYKTFVKMTSSWLYTFIADKNRCSNFYYDGKTQEFVNLLVDIGLTKEDAAYSIKLNEIMRCFCETENITDENIDKCVNIKLGDLCGSGNIFTDEGRCITKGQACMEAYGANILAANDGSCYCKSGYTWNSSETGCIKICPSRMHNSGNSCVCDAGYISSGGSCKLASEMCTYREYYSNGKCICSYLYPIEYAGKCLTYTEHCLTTFSNTYGVSDGKGSSTCDCNSGYVWNINDSGCVSKASVDQICKRDIGPNSYYLGYKKDGKYMCN